ncbi:MAG: transporter [Proteobacteria bacterium]|nr:transporter [Pseudomonadota bacterium]
MPTGLNFAGVGIGHIEGDIFFDPLLLVENAEFDMEVLGLVYVRSFGLFGKSARVDLNLPYLAGRWEGTVDSELVDFRRRGLGDARLRLSVLLYGGPAVTKAEFAKSKKSNTVVGAAISVSMPTGEYSSDRLINLGSNRWVVRPQLGVTHTRGKWVGELTGSVFLYGDNDEFWKQTVLETDPLLALQAHLIYTFRPGLWAAGGIAYGWGGEAIVNNISKNNISGNLLTALSFGYPLSRTQGIKLTLLTGRTQKSTGVDINSLIFSYSLMF